MLCNYLHGKRIWKRVGVWTCVTESLCCYLKLTQHRKSPTASCLSRVWLFATPWTVAHQAFLSMGFSRQEYWSGLPGPPSRVFVTQRSNPHLLHLHWYVGSLPLAPSGNLKSHIPKKKKKRFLSGKRHQFSKVPSLWLSFLNDTCKYGVGWDPRAYCTLLELKQHPRSAGSPCGFCAASPAFLCLLSRPLLP